MKLPTVSIYLLTTGLLSPLALGAPTTTTVEKSRDTTPDAAAEEVVGQTRGLTRGCTSNRHYYVNTGGVETIYSCRGGCTTDSMGQPRCNDGVVSSVKHAGPETAPFSVVPVHRARDE